MPRAVTPFIEALSLFNAIVGHSWWSLVTSDEVTSDQWPSGVTPIALFSDKPEMNRVTARGILFHPFERAVGTDNELYLIMSYLFHGSDGSYEQPFQTEFLSS